MNQVYPDIMENSFCCGSSLVSLKRAQWCPEKFSRKEIETFTDKLKIEGKRDRYHGFFYWTLTNGQITDEMLEFIYGLGWILLAESKSAHGNYPIYHLGFIARPYKRNQDEATD